MTEAISVSIQENQLFKTQLPNSDRAANKAALSTSISSSSHERKRQIGKLSGSKSFSYPRRVASECGQISDVDVFCPPSTASTMATTGSSSFDSVGGRSVQSEYLRPKSEEEERKNHFDLGSNDIYALSTSQQMPSSRSQSGRQCKSATTSDHLEYSRPQFHPLRPSTAPAAPRSASKYTSESASLRSARYIANQWRSRAVQWGTASKMRSRFPSLLPELPKKLAGKGTSIGSISDSDGEEKMDRLGEAKHVANVWKEKKEYYTTSHVTDDFSCSTSNTSGDEESAMTPSRAETTTITDHSAETLKARGGRRRQSNESYEAKKVVFSIRKQMPDITIDNVFNASMMSSLSSRPSSMSCGDTKSPKLTISGIETSVVIPRTASEDSQKIRLHAAIEEESVCGEDEEESEKIVVGDSGRSHNEESDASPIRSKVEESAVLDVFFLRNLELIKREPPDVSPVSPSPTYPPPPLPPIGPDDPPVLRAIVKTASMQMDLTKERQVAIDRCVQSKNISSKEQSTIATHISFEDFKLAKEESVLMSSSPSVPETAVIAEVTSDEKKLTRPTPKNSIIKDLSVCVKSNNQKAPTPVSCLLEKAVPYNVFDNKLSTATLDLSESIGVFPGSDTSTIESNNKLEGGLQTYTKGSALKKLLKHQKQPIETVVDLTKTTSNKLSLSKSNEVSSAIVPSKSVSLVSAAVTTDSWKEKITVISSKEPTSMMKSISLQTKSLVKIQPLVTCTSPVIVKETNKQPLNEAKFNPTTFDDIVPTKMCSRTTGQVAEPNINVDPVQSRLAMGSSLTKKWFLEYVSFSFDLITLSGQAPPYDTYASLHKYVEYDIHSLRSRSKLLFEVMNRFTALVKQVRGEGLLIAGDCSIYPLSVESNVSYSPPFERPGLVCSLVKAVVPVFKVQNVKASKSADYLIRVALKKAIDDGDFEGLHRFFRLG